MFVFPCFMKLHQFQQYLAKNDLDLAFFSHPDIHLTYFTQHKFSYAFMVITPHDAQLHYTALDLTPVIPGFSVHLLKKGWEKKQHSTAIKKIAVNKETMTLAQQERLHKLFPHATFVDVSEILVRLRLEKTLVEIQKIKRACDITSKAFDELVTAFSKKQLWTEQSVAFFLEQKIREQGGEVAFPTIVAMGKNAAVPHHVTSLQKLHRGFLLLDYGASYQYYCADMTRVVFLGKPTKQEKQWYDLLLQAQEKTIKHISNQKAFTELTAVANKRLGKYAHNFIHSLGHGIGLEVHEAPVFSDPKQKVHHNYVFTIEPGIYFPKKLGLRIEDTILFDGKANILTKAPKELITVNY